MKDILLDEMVEQEDKPVMPVCHAKQYVAEKGPEYFANAFGRLCTDNCDGKDAECVSWIGEYGIDGKGWKSGERE